MKPTCIIPILIMLSFTSCGHLKKTSRPGHFAVVNQTIPSAIFDVKYYSNDNFIGSRIDGYEKPLCLLSELANSALIKVQKEMDLKGYTLKIFDCYRPQRAVDHFIRWAKDLSDQKMKGQYYPNEDKSQLFEKGYIADKSGHSRGSTLDLTLTQKSDLSELDMGTPFDYFDSLSNTASPNITKEQRNNRLLLKAVMEKYGFKNYEKEWWHYTLNNEPYPDTYFNFPIK